MPTILVVGASRGIGLEMAKQYRQAGWRVHATYRTDKQPLEALGGDLHTHQLEVTRPADIAALKKRLADEPIDILCYNAGIYGQYNDYLGNTDDELWLQALRVNTLAALNVIAALAENVSKSERRIVAAMSSKMGSMSDNSSGGSYIYRSSKAALNAVMKSLSIDLADQYDITTVILHPGWVITDMTGTNALITAEESVRGISNVLGSCRPAHNGGFFDYRGNLLPW